MKWSASGLFVLCNEHDQPSLSRCVSYSQIFAASHFLNSLVPRKIIYRILHPSSREIYSFTFTWNYFHRIFYRPPPQSVQIYLQRFYVAIIHDFPIYYTVVCEKFNSWLQVPPNIIYITKQHKWVQHAAWRYPDVTPTSSDNCQGKARSHDWRSMGFIVAPNNNWEQESATDWDKVLVYRPQAKCICLSVGR